MGLFKELVSFYNFFDLSVLKAKEFPDHLKIELDFMHFLTFKEVERIHSEREAGSFARAGRDFLERHLGRWAPLLCQRVKDSEGLEFFQGLTGLLETFVGYEAKFLNQRLILESD